MEKFVQNCLKEFGEKEWKLLGEVLANVKKLKLQSWFEKNLIVCLRWNDQYDERMVVIQMVVI